VFAFYNRLKYTRKERKSQRKKGEKNIEYRTRNIEGGNRIQETGDRRQETEAWWSGRGLVLSAEFLVVS